VKITYFTSKLKFLRALFAFLIINCLISNYLISQSNIKFESFSKKQGISQGSILAIIQDKKGFIWFGTQDGLNKYDGYVFSVYKHNPYDINSISDNFIWSIYEDSEGMLWIGTSSGLDKFDPVYEKWWHFHNVPNKQVSLGDRIAVSFCEDKTGVLWIGTKCEGLFILKDGVIKLYQYKDELSHYRIWQIHEDKTGAIWFATSNGLFKYEPYKSNWIHYKNDPNHPNSLSDDRISSLYEDENGGLWIGTRKGLNYFDQKNKQWTTYLHDPQNQDSLIHNNIRSICPGEKNILWVGTENGLSKFDTNQGTWTNFEHDTHDPDSLNRNNIYSVYRDRTGKIWIGTAAGLNKVDPLKGMWTHYKNKPSDPNSLNDNFVSAIYEDREGVLWIGTAYSGLNKLNRKSGKWKLYTHDPDNPNSLSNNIIRTIYEDRANRLWIGTDWGLNKFDRKKEKWTVYKHDPNNQNSLSDNRVRVIFEDKTGGFWIGTWEGGISRFDREKGNWIHYNKNDPDYPKGSSTDFIRSILEDNSGLLWIGTDYGLIKLDKEKENWTHYKNERGNPNSLSNNSVMSICEDTYGKLWIGTRIGLNSFDKGKEKWSLYTEKNGLPSDFIQKVLKDNQGNLWISTNNGLSRLNPGTLVFKNYDKSDGLHGQEFIEGAFFNQKTGEMFFGGTNGFVAFYPDKIKSNLHIPPLVITSFNVFDKKINLSSINEIKLPYDQNFISFEFSALDYTTPHKNRYAFKMTGVDKKWNYRDSTMRYASYTKLPAGKYVFHVKGSNNDNIWNEEGILFKVIITPPWWKTWWFILLSIISFSFFSYFVIGFFRKYFYLVSFWKRKTSVGQYKFIEKIASGGMGMIYRAHDKSKTNLYAVKVMRDEFSNDEIQRKRFKNEALMIEMFNHPNIVKVIERGEDHETLYTVMELIDGINLSELMNKEKKLNINIVVNIMIQIANVLNIIHEKNIIHRDLKPENIMIVKTKENPFFIKLLDFGLAKLEILSRLTQTGEIVGTYYYLSPEQILDKDVSTKIDIYSLGILSYEMLTGKKPFEGKNKVSIINQILESEPAHLSDLALNYPSELNTLIMKMIDKNPKNRPTAKELLSILTTLKI